LATMDGISAKASDGSEKTFVYRSDAHISGKSFEALATDVLNAALKELASIDVTVGNPGAGLPGQGLLGNSISRRASYEAELSPQPKAPMRAVAPLKESYVDITYEWKGWQISKDGLLAIVKEISDRFGFKFYPPNILSTTTKVQFYDVQLRMSIYQEGIDALVNLKPEALQEAIKVGSKLKSPESAAQFLQNFAATQKRYRESVLKGNGADATKFAEKMISSVESTVSAKAFIALLGGDRNIFVKSTINGFRVNDATGDTALISDTIGEVGSMHASGPLRYIMNNLGMTESEFFIYWLLNKI
jgi:hypothetical protein